MITTSQPIGASSTTYTITPAKAHDWAQCGGFYAARYEPGARFRPTYASLLGTAVHELAVAYDRFVRPSEPDYGALLTRHWRPGRFGDDEEQARAEAQVMVATYVNVTAAETATVLEHECFAQTARRSCGTSASIVLSGRMDRVARLPGGAIEVLDLKTGCGLPTPDELQRDLGSAIYHLIAAERYNVPDVALVQLSLRTGARTEVRLSPDDLELGKERLRAMVGEMASRHYSLSPNGICAYCPSRSDCLALHPSTEATCESF